MSDPEVRTAAAEGPRVGLFVTCLVDLFRPNVGFAAVKLLRDAGCRVVVPPFQTCCGQPAYNSGDAPAARRIARQVVAAFEPFDYTVAPSGSCAGMLRIHFPALFETDARWRERAEGLAARTFELTSFLVDVMEVDAVSARYSGRAAYHDSCSGLRELGVRAEPRALLGSVGGLEVAELEEPEACCGFGGTFCVKYPEISGRMVANKVADIAATGADTVLAGDLGCLLNIAGRLRREGRPARVFHVAEVLAGLTEGAGSGGIGAPRGS